MARVFFRSDLYLRVLVQFLQLLSGLAYLHRKGVIHGDLKPVSAQVQSPRGMLNTSSGTVDEHSH